MTNTESNIVYFKELGPTNTDQTLQLAKKRAEQLGIKNIIVASTTGQTGIKASQIFKDYNLIVITHVTGFTKPNNQQMETKNRKTIEQNGAKTLTTAHAFGILGRAVNKKFQTLQVDGIISATLPLRTRNKSKL
jgi:hypothetical protein